MKASAEPTSDYNAPDREGEFHFTEAERQEEAKLFWSFAHQFQLKALFLPSPTLLVLYILLKGATSKNFQLPPTLYIYAGVPFVIAVTVLFCGFHWLIRDVRAFTKAQPEERTRKRFIQAFNSLTSVSSRQVRFTLAVILTAAVVCVGSIMTQLDVPALTALLIGYVWLYYLFILIAAYYGLCRRMSTPLLLFWSKWSGAAWGTRRLPLRKKILMIIIGMSGAMNCIMGTYTMGFFAKELRIKTEQECAEKLREETGRVFKNHSPGGSGEAAFYFLENDSLVKLPDSLSSSTGTLKPSTVNVMMNLLGIIVSQTCPALLTSYLSVRWEKTSLYQRFTFFTGSLRLI